MINKNIIKQLCFIVKRCLVNSTPRLSTQQGCWEVLYKNIVGISGVMLYKEE